MQTNLTNRPEKDDRTIARAVCDRPDTAPWCSRVRALLSEERFGHVMRVAELAEAIARANGFTEREIRTTVLAAVLHDAARELSAEELFRLAPPQLQVEIEHPLTVHGRAGRKMAEQWGITDEGVLSAIEGHVFGVDVSNRPGVALYVADVTEPGRGVNADIRQLAHTDLLAAYRQSVAVTVEYLTSVGKPIHPETRRICRELCPAD